MSDTTGFLKVEEWYREKIKLENKYPGCSITKENVPLSNWGSNGYFECDVVIKDGKKIIEVQCLSCSSAKTANGKNAIGKFHKIKADALMLTGIRCKRKMLAFTEKSMYEKILKEKKNGRFPIELELEFVDVDDPRIKELIRKTSETSSKEITK